MTCPMCGIHAKDRQALTIITKVPGCWEIRTHQGHIVKLARKDKEMTINEAIARYKGELLTDCDGMVE